MQTIYSANLDSKGDCQNKNKFFYVLNKTINIKKGIKRKQTMKLYLDYLCFRMALSNNFSI
jgi:hypothetical protein